MTETLVEMLQRGESRARGYNDYNRYAPPEGGVGHFRGADRRIDFSQMTLGEIRDNQRLAWNHPDKLHAVGRYQVIGITLSAAMADLNLGRDQRFTPELQDRILVDYLLKDKQPAIHAYITGRPGASLREAQVAMGNEWASVAHPDYGGRSRYAGNHASISLEQSAEALQGARAQYRNALASGATPEQAWRQAAGLGLSATQTQQADPLRDGILQAGERGDAVKQLQQSLNQMQFRDARGQPLETQSGIYGQRTAEAVRNFQQANGLEQTGVADARTLAAVRQQAQLPADQRNTSTAAQETSSAQGQTRWPAPGNTQLNRADQQGEGHGEFGTSRGGGRRTHGGVDIQGDVGDPIVAYDGGTVRVQRNNGAAGHTVTIDHGNGVRTRYMHLHDINVRDGQRIEAGDQIGTMGRTGNTPARGDTHLHFEMWRDGRKVDPMPHLRGLATEQTPNSSVSRATHAIADGVLRQNERGAEVQGLQNSLNQLNMTDARGRPLQEDGIFGQRTREAIEKFQRAHGLQPVNGMADPKTLEAIGRQLPKGQVTIEKAEVTGVADASRSAPLITDSAHPNNALYAAIAKHLPPGTRPEAIANVTLQTMENGMTDASKIGKIGMANNGDVVVSRAGSMGGDWIRVDLAAPTATLRQMSDHMAAQSRESQEKVAVPEASRQRVTPDLMQ